MRKNKGEHGVNLHVPRPLAAALVE
jgi:hypothetical protein